MILKQVYRPQKYKNKRPLKEQLMQKTYLYQINPVNMKVHFIAIGGSAMHNLAIALRKKGYTITGSDDEIFNPSRTRLHKYGLLPEKMGWDASNIHDGLDAVILGMHAKGDNPELQKAREMGLKIYSYPEFLFEQSLDKTRIVIGGSHGKTTITSMVLHVLNYHHIATDFMVGAQLEGFEVMVSLSDEAAYMVMEGDEYPSSALDLRPKFHLYNPHIALISGIAWDHINVFKTFSDYLEQFRRFIACIEPGGKLIYNQTDGVVKEICEGHASEDIHLYPYDLPDFEIHDGKTLVRWMDALFSVRFFGKHNLLNMNGARVICNQLGVDDQMFYEAIGSFGGASKRMQLIHQQPGIRVIRDFAHAPSKVRATVEAVREQYPGASVVACLELHTYSSLNRSFIDQYQGALDAADQAIVFYSPHALALKKLPDLNPDEVYQAFGKKGLSVSTNKEDLLGSIKSPQGAEIIFLMMSSGDFGGLAMDELMASIDLSD